MEKLEKLKRIAKTANGQFRWTDTANGVIIAKVVS